MAIYDGFVSLGEDEVHVILGVEEDRVTLSSNGAEIGAWDSDEIAILYVGGGTYTITAEDETLEFVPNDHDLFAIRYGEVSDNVQSSSPNGSGRHSRATAARGPVTETRQGSVREAPPPRTLTRIAFYTLAGVTAFLGLWAIVSMIFG